MPHEERRAARQDVVGPPAARDSDAAALPRVLVHDGAQPQGPPVLRPLVDAVVGPDVVRPLRPAPRAGASGGPEPPPVRGFAGHPQPLLPPAPLHPLVVHPPALGPQQGRDAAVAVAPEAPRQGDQAGDQGGLVPRHPGRAPLCPARLGQPPTGPMLRDGHDGLHVRDRLPPARRAQKFPNATSLRIALSRA